LQATARALVAAVGELAVELVGRDAGQSGDDARRLPGPGARLDQPAQRLARLRARARSRRGCADHEHYLSARLILLVVGCELAGSTAADVLVQLGQLAAYGHGPLPVELGQQT